MKQRRGPTLGGVPPPPGSPRRRLPTPVPPDTTRPAMTRTKAVAKDSASKPIIGWREWIRLPDLGVDLVKAKVDTGARTSSLHAFNLQETMRDGVPHIRFLIHPEQRRAHPTIEAELPLVAERRVRDSGGKTELRPVVKTVVELLGQRWPIEITLTRRDAMGFRMLLGRQAIRRRFLVDPGGSFFGGKRVRKKRSSQKGRKP